MAAEKRSLSDPDEVIMITMPPATIARTTAKTGPAIDTPVRRIHARKFDPGVCSLDSLCCEVGTAISTSSYCPISSRATKRSPHQPRTGPGFRRGEGGGEWRGAAFIDFMVARHLSS